MPEHKSVHLDIGVVWCPECDICYVDVFLVWKAAGRPGGVFDFLVGVRAFTHAVAKLFPAGLPRTVAFGGVKSCG